MRVLKSVSKRIISAILASIMIVGLVGCGKDNGNIGFGEHTEELDDEQRAAVNMYNYLLLVNEEINASKGNQLLLEEIYSSLFNNTNTEYIDGTTREQINNLLDTIQDYKMIDNKRERLERIYEQNKAKAFISAIPDLSAISYESGDSLLETVVASVGGTMPLFIMNSANIVLGSSSEYLIARNEAEMEFLNDNWELDDEEMAVLHESTKNAFNYMFDIAKGYKIADDYILRQEDVQSFVEWRSQPSENNTGKLEWFKTNEKTYENFGPYWLELAKADYISNKYKECLDCIQTYQDLNVNIFRKDKEYGRTLAVAINAAQETMSDDQYIEYAKKCCDEIINNSNDEDSDLRYYAAMTYVGLYEKTNDQQYLSIAYDITKNNVNNLAKQQRELNEEYLNDVKEMDTPSDASKRQKKEIKQINKLLKEERKIALPPVLESLTLNCDLLKVLSEKLDKGEEELDKLDSMLHTDSKKAIFLTEGLDEKYWFSAHNDEETEVAEDKFEKKTLTVPAVCLSENCEVKVVVTNDSGATVFEDWVIDEVKRPKDSGLSGYTATFSSKSSDDYKYQIGDKISVIITPLKGYLDEKEYDYEAVASKIPFVVDIVKVGE